ncbi:macrolide 2'-phosphotransferase [Salipaludibacillus keqinensis]|uniref:Macrolide 2'-phosphotransferase n=1 Tax=Salipaludibacillus keqinensis TaxID=2045207 RepID=A0A323TYV6_9BACI|nr:macrolide 2'-phosphotransferase [Salipaludibacillus keqinensis]PYZ94765.1 macrolide 2'-phosphotransferase [Salipaludibacillus keqinensis]
MNTHKVKQLAYSRGLDVLEESIKINESGVDFQVAYAEDQRGDKWILRMARRPESMRHAQQEKKALDILKTYVNFQVPEWSIFSEDLIAYKQLSGAPAATIDVEKQDYVWRFNKEKVPATYYESLGEALADLHAIPPDALKNTGVEVVGASELRAVMKQRMDRVKGQYDVNQDLWERWQAWLADDSLWPTQVGVKHGDLHPGHTLIDKNNHVTGFIDWTEVGIGDVSVDFLSYQLLFGSDGLKKLIDAYDNAGGTTWPRMEEHIEELLTTSGITVAEYAQASGLKEMHEAAKSMLAKS